MLAALAALPFAVDAPAVSATLAVGLLVGYAALRWLAPAPAEHRWGARARWWAHVTCGAVIAFAGALGSLTGSHPSLLTAAVVLGAGLGFAGEALARTPWTRSRDGARAFLAWSVLLPLVAAVVGALLDAAAAAPAAMVLALAVARYRGRYVPDAAWLAPSIATMAAAGLVVRGLLVRAGWPTPAAVTLAALALTASLGAWTHWWLRRPLGLASPRAYASAWALVAVALALAASVGAGPLTAATGLAALVLVALWFGFAAVESGHDRHGHLALATLLLLYLDVRIGPFGAGLSAALDAGLLVSAALALHFAADLLDRAQLAALVRPARVGARLLPLVATAVAAAALAHGDGSLTTVVLVVLAETIGILYTVGHRRGGHPVLGLAAAAYYDVGLLLLAQRGGLRDALWYTVPTGVTIIALARVYRTNLDARTRRALRTLGGLLIYVTGFYQALRFDGGGHALVLGGATLVGLALGDAMEWLWPAPGGAAGPRCAPARAAPSWPGT